MNLKWENFDGNAVSTIASHRSDSNFSDVTLVCSDLVKIPSHKMILSSSSDYFKTFFEDICQQNPYICLDSISSKQMNSILDFIYFGIVKIEEKDLEKFLAISTRLKIHGLEKQKQYSNEEQIHEAEEEVVGNCAEEEKVVPKNEDKEMLFWSKDYKSMPEEHTQATADGKFECQLCGKVSRMKHVIMNHIETHLNGIVYECTLCNKSFKTRNSLSVHKSIYHRFT